MSDQKFSRVGSQPFLGGEAHAGMAIGAENILAKVLGSSIADNGPMHSFFIDFVPKG